MSVKLLPLTKAEGLSLSSDVSVLTTIIQPFLPLDRRAAQVLLRDTASSLSNPRSLLAAYNHEEPRTNYTYQDVV